MLQGRFTYDYPRPMVTVDAVVFSVNDGDLEVLLIKRGHAPFEGMWALPGGFVEIDESLDHAVTRELAEETGIADVPLKQFHTFGAIGRDPRGRVITVGYLGITDRRRHVPRAADDAAAVTWLPARRLPRLASDHNEMIDYAVRALSDLVRPPAFCRGWLPDTLPLEDLTRALNMANSAR